MPPQIFWSTGSWAAPSESTSPRSSRSRLEAPPHLHLSLSSPSRITVILSSPTPSWTISSSSPTPFHDAFQEHWAKIFPGQNPLLQQYSCTSKVNTSTLKLKQIEAKSKWFFQTGKTQERILLEILSWVRWTKRRPLNRLCLIYKTTSSNKCSLCCGLIDIWRKNIAKGTTAPRVEWLLHSQSVYYAVSSVGNSQ